MTSSGSLTTQHLLRGDNAATTPPVSTSLQASTGHATATGLSPRRGGLAERLVGEADERGEAPIGAANYTSIPEFL